MANPQKSVFGKRFWENIHFWERFWEKLLVFGETENA